MDVFVLHHDSLVVLEAQEVSALDRLDRHPHVECQEVGKGAHWVDAECARRVHVCCLRSARRVGSPIGECRHRIDNDDARTREIELHSRRAVCPHVRDVVNFGVGRASRAGQAARLIHIRVDIGPSNVGGTREVLSMPLAVSGASRDVRLVCDGHTRVVQRNSRGVVEVANLLATGDCGGRARATERVPFVCCACAVRSAWSVVHER